MRQPIWHKPSFPEPAQLKVFNSLTRQKEPFLVRNNQVSWYICGPTVYDHSHLGHARTYISFDIIRRLLEDYFSYNLLYVMNITDIDDKIIISARQQHLFKQFMLNFDPAVVSTALDYYVELRFGKYGASVQDWPAFKVKVEQQQLTSDDAKFKLYVDNVDKCLECIGSTTVDEKYYSNCKEVVKSYLDSLYGNSVTDQQIYKEFTLYWEQDYFKNMDRLNIKRPDVLTRVTEYVPEVVEYCQKIIDNGFAYESNGSLYFDVLKFNDSGHDYAKLAPWAASNLKLLQEGEGDLADGSGKRNSSDFALWKASKQGEPFWPSPWGNGRPGWHIECSVMASCVLGSNMDVHCGGIDLQFPHHDNELAQSEAYYDCKQWVNYFLHSGHLHIENLKMSKSLKNFITINETLESTTSSQLRLLFLLHQWDTVLDYSVGSISEAKSVEATLKNFVSLVTALENDISAISANSNTHNYRVEEKQLMQTVLETQTTVHEALCDNFNTPAAMQAIRSMVSAANIYYSSKVKSKLEPNLSVLKKASNYVVKLLTIFGVFDSKDSSTSSDSLLPCLKTMSVFRDNVRKVAISNQDTQLILDLCDKLRDVELPEHGVSIEDREGGPALLKLVDKQVLLAQRAEKQLRMEQAAASKLASKQQQEKARFELLEKAKIKPIDLFKTSEYSEWDAEGLPTKTSDGQEVSKSRRKKLAKEMDNQQKLHLKYYS